MIPLSFFLHYHYRLGVSLRIPFGFTINPMGFCDTRFCSGTPILHCSMTCFKDMSSNDASVEFVPANELRNHGGSEHGVQDNLNSSVFETPWSMHSIELRI